MSNLSKPEKQNGLSRLGWLSLALLITWLILPLIPLALWSVSQSWFFPDLFPSKYSLRAWSYALSSTSGVPEALWTSTVIASGTTILAAIIGIPAGRALGLYNFRGKALVELLILAPTIVPGIAVVLGLHVIFLNLGLANNVGGVMIVHLIPTLPYMVLVMASVFANYKPEAEAQARSLGASPIAVFWFVTLPAIMPGLIIGSFFAFLVSWSQYILTLIIGGGLVVTVPLLLFNFATSGRNDITGAIALLYILPGIIVLLVGAKKLSARNTLANRANQL
ncbi:ABC transporter permease subunit [Sneathiella marina]|uniref:ABC transporter permease subunit n=1 Tax=Sneathiella marina TaxID=2950108 RepID=A0ABY4W8W5_9PROT|nr:ABC transporter permease subunit [Sneathiella marina]USG61714.1 ABC transporter permease subunit [Sneathiella marina]